MAKPNTSGPLYYWDASVLLSYIEETPDRVDVIEELLEEADAGKHQIFTSFITITEVAWGKAEKEGKALDPRVEERIDGLWHPDSPVRLVEVHQLVTLDARTLMRHAIEIGWGLKPLDALHLATAKRIGASAVHSYDSKWPRWSEQLSLPIGTPTVSQVSLFPRSGRPALPAPTETPDAPI